MSWLFVSGGQSIGASALVLPMNIQFISFRTDWFYLRTVQGTLKSLLQHYSSKASILWCSAFFMVQLSHPYMTTGKNIAVGKLMSLIFNTLSRFLIAFHPRSKCLLISWLQSPSTVILEPKKIKSVTVFIFSPSISHEVMWPDSMILHKLWKILKEMGIPDHLTCLLRNLYAGQEATVRTGHGTTDWLQIGKRQGCILSPCLFNLYGQYIMRNDGLEEAQAGIKIARRNINNLRYADDTTLMAESKEELKSPLMKVKEESEKAGLKFNIQKTKIMASGPITSWPIDGKTVETMTDFIFLGSKITAVGNCSHEIKRRLLLRRKALTNLDSILKKQRHYFANKGPSSQSYGFSSSHVWMKDF